MQRLDRGETGLWDSPSACVRRRSHDSGSRKVAVEARVFGRVDFRGTTFQFPVSGSWFQLWVEDSSVCFDVRVFYAQIEPGGEWNRFDNRKACFVPKHKEKRSDLALDDSDRTYVAQSSGSGTRPESPRRSEWAQCVYFRVELLVA
jgi:hypothetical protein